jgi:hypothetical protein
MSTVKKTNEIVSSEPSNIGDQLKAASSEMLKHLERPRTIEAVWSKVVHSKDINPK